MKVRRFDLPLQLPNSAALPQLGSFHGHGHMGDTLHDGGGGNFRTKLLVGETLRNVDLLTLTVSITIETLGDFRDFEHDIVGGAERVISQNC